MRRTLTWTGPSLLVMTLILACSATNENKQPDRDDDGGSAGTGNPGGSAPFAGSSGTGPTSGGNAGTTGSAGAGNPAGGAPTGAGGSVTAGTTGMAGTGVSGTTGSGGASGAGGGGAVVCSNTDKSTLPIDETGWIDRSCNDRGIQGPFYCYSDKLHTTSCVEGVEFAATMLYRAGSGVCLTGDTTAAEGSWGAGIGLGLNETGGDASVKMAYNATANNVTGFKVNVTGDTGGLPIRIGFTTAADAAGAQPFVQVPGAGEEYPITIADAVVPEAWENEPNAGVPADPSSIYDMQIQIAGDSAATHYDFCVQSITPITSGEPMMGGEIQDYGQRICGDFDKVNVGSYMVQNNAYNKGGGSQCITAKWDMGQRTGFTAEPQLNIATGGPPASYPSVVYGWHVDGVMYGAYQTAKQLSAIGSATSSWSFTAPTAGRWNASYDIWIHNSSARPGNTGGTLELMIWLAKRDTTPIGSQVAPSVTLGGQSYEVWYGTHDGFSTVSYIRTTNIDNVTGLDLKPFFADAVTRGYATSGAYLLGVQAGFEIWEGNTPFTSNSFQVSVN
jgi:hypothetical protein